MPIWEGMWPRCLDWISIETLSGEIRDSSLHDITGDYRIQLFRSQVITGDYRRQLLRSQDITGDYRRQLLSLQNITGDYRRLQETALEITGLYREEHLKSEEGEHWSEEGEHCQQATCEVNMANSELPRDAAREAHIFVPPTEQRAVIYRLLWTIL